MMSNGLMLLVQKVVPRVVVEDRGQCQKREVLLHYFSHSRYVMFN